MGKKPLVSELPAGVGEAIMEAKLELEALLERHNIMYGIAIKFAAKEQAVDVDKYKAAFKKKEGKFYIEFHQKE